MWLSTLRLPFTATFPYYDTDLAPHYFRLAASPAHFDGVHYLRLADKGYDDEGSQAFFPLYPLLIRALILTGLDPVASALLLNLACLAGLMSLLPRRAFILLLAFPASFFLLAVYTESLFLFLLALALSLISSRRYHLAALAIGLLTATRLVGLMMLIPLAWALWPQVKKLTLYLPLAASGFFSYSLYLWQRYGDPLKFFHVQPLFGGGRVGEGIVWLPQVLYRYGRIVLTVSPNSWLYWRSLLELGVFGLILFLLYHFRRRLPLPLALYCLAVVILPSFSGTLSSLPRYALAALPLFQIVASWLPPRLFALTVSCCVPLLIFLTAIFVSGQFVA